MRLAAVVEMQRTLMLGELEADLQGCRSAAADRPNVDFERAQAERHN